MNNQQFLAMSNKKAILRLSKMVLFRTVTATISTKEKLYKSKKNIFKLKQKRKRTTDNSNQLDIGDINLQPLFVQAQSTVNVTTLVKTIKHSSFAFRSTNHDA
jgi:hypothetical protein